MRLTLYASLASLVLLNLVRSSTAAEPTLDEFLASSGRMNDVKQIGLVLASQTDPNVAERNARELRKSHWAASPRAALSPPDAEVELKRWDAEWDRVNRVIVDRKITGLSLAGIDLVLLRRTQDWYYAANSPRGPVMIRVSVQYYDDAPMTIHGIRVWTDWDQIKYISERIHLPARDTVFSVEYERPKSPSESNANQ